MNSTNMGDANKLKNLLSSFGLDPSITLIPTRINPNGNDSLIDNIFTSFQNNICSSGTLTKIISDHLPIFLLTHLPHLEKKEKNQSIPCSSKIITDYDMLNDKLSNVSWQNILDNDNTSNSYNLFIEQYTNLIQDSSQQYTRKYRYIITIAKWMNKSILNLIKAKDDFFRQYLKHKKANADIKTKFTLLCNQISKEKKIAKLHYTRSKLLAATGDSRKTWQVIENLKNDFKPLLKKKYIT